MRKFADFGKAALTIASVLVLPGSLATTLAVAGEMAGYLINCVNWDKERNDRIAVSVEKALQQVRNDVPQGAQRIVDELIGSLNTPFALEERIKQTESYLVQCETPKTQRDIATKFETYFRMEMSKYSDLYTLIRMLDGFSTVLDSLELRVQNHDLTLNNQEQIISELKAEMERLHMEPSLCLPGSTPGVKLIGRENDLEVFSLNFEKHGKICVVSGIGGVGKTEFIKTYLQEHRDTFGRVGWFEYRNSFRDTLLTVLGLVLHSSAPTDDSLARYNEIMGMLRQLKSEDLIVFDNVSKVESAEDIDDILALPCKVIFTTRDTFDEDRNRLLVYDINFLNVEACEALFSHYRGEETTKEERPSLLEVIRLSGQHTLALELMAKTCAAAGLTVRDLLERLNKDGFNLDGIREEVRREGGRESKRFLEHMLKLYDIADIKALGMEAEWLLANLSVLLLQDFDIKVLVEWLELPDRVLLNRLNERGWIRISRDKVTMHAAIAEIIRAVLKPDSERCGMLIEAIRRSINYSQTDVMIYQALYLHCAESVIRYMDGETINVADLCAAVGFVEKAQGYYSGALLNFQRTTAIREKVLGKEHLDTAIAYNNLASIYQILGDYNNSLTFYLKSIAIREKVLGKENANTNIAYNNLASFYQDRGDYKNALKFYQKARSTFEQTLGREHPRTAMVYNNLGNLYYIKGDYKNALKYILDAIHIREIALGREHPDTAGSYGNLGIVYLDLGDYKNALAYLKKAVTIQEKVLGIEHRETATAYNNLADLYQVQGDYEKAIEYHLRSLAIRKRVLGMDHPDVSMTYTNLGSLYQVQGDYKSASMYYEQAISIREKVLGKDHPDTALTYLNMAQLYIKMGKKDKAVLYAKKAYDVFRTKLGEEHRYTKAAKNIIDKTGR